MAEKCCQRWTRTEGGGAEYVERVAGEGGGKCPGRTLACGSDPSGPLAVAEVDTTNSAPISAATTPAAPNPPPGQLVALCGKDEPACRINRHSRGSSLEEGQTRE